MNLVNSLACWIIKLDMNSNQKKLLFSQDISYSSEDPCLYKACGHGILRRCMPNMETNSIISRLHDLPYGGHETVAKIATMIFQDDFYWPNFFQRCAQTCLSLSLISKD